MTTSPHNMSDANQRAMLDARHHVLIIIAGTFLALTWLLFGARTYVKVIILHSWAIDDYMLSLALAMFTGYASVTLYLMTSLPWYFMSLDQIERGFSGMMASEVLYISTHIFLKLSLGFLFLRLTIEKWQRWMIRMIIVSSTGVNIVFIAIVIFQCGNPRDMFLKYIRQQCIPIKVCVGLLFSQAAFTAATDWAYALFPLTLLRGAQFNPRVKVSVAIIILLGVSGSTCSLIRFKYIPGLVDMMQLRWNGVNIGIWSVVEPGTGIIALCLATLRPLFRKFFANPKTEKRSSDVQRNLPIRTQSRNGSYSQGHMMLESYEGTSLDDQESTDKTMVTVRPLSDNSQEQKDESMMEATGPALIAGFHVEIPQRKQS